MTRAASVVNQALVLRNWVIGGCLVEFEQAGEDRAAYGQRLLKHVAADLTKHRIKGLGVRMLERCRTFYLMYPQLGQKASSLVTLSSESLTPNDIQKSSSLMTILGRRDSSCTVGADAPTILPSERLLQLSWTHLIELIRLDDPWKRAFYENECVRANWSVRQLKRQIGSLLYERTGLSTDKVAVIEAARAQTTAPANIAEILRDPYILEFTGLAERPSYLEKDLETALLDDLQAFLLELGAGFCFEARQKRITVANEHDYVDLVFYHRILRCHLLIDLKTRAFQHGDAGQMNFYVNYWKDRMMEPGDQPPVGLLLCSDRDHTKVEYATAGMDEQLFVSRYLVALPKPDELQAFVERDRASRIGPIPSFAVRDRFRIALPSGARMKHIAFQLIADKRTALRCQIDT